VTDFNPFAIEGKARLDWALFYAAQGWPVFPCSWSGGRAPLVKWRAQASTDPEQIRQWWTRWPPAFIGAPAGIGFVVLDVDVRADRDGFDTLKALLDELPVTRAVRTPRAGMHYYFEVPEPPIRNTTGEYGRGIGVGLDWRGEGGFVRLPAPGTSYEWVDTGPLAPVPPSLLPRPTPLRVAGVARPCTQLTRYGHAALLSALENILRAPSGQQEITLHNECFAMGSLAAAGHLPPDIALEILLYVKDFLTSYDPTRLWRREAVAEHISRSFALGMENPRPYWDETERRLDEQLKGATDVEP
jgi:hypothetical protein